MEFADLPILTDRLRLRPLRKADVHALFAMYSDPLVMRFWSDPPWTSIDSAYEMIRSTQAAIRRGEYLQ